MRICSGMLKRFEPVKIFDQFLSLRGLQRENIPFREFVRVVFDCFVDVSGLNSVEFCYVPELSNWRILSLAHLAK
jgi:hypothetical protein